MADAFYTPTGDAEVFLATPHTEGPWEPGVQHGGPPAALLARAIEGLPSRFPGQIGRLTFEILGPVPVGEVTVTARVTRPGRSVELVEAELIAGGRSAVRAYAWKIRTVALDLPAVAAPPPAPVPDTVTELSTLRCGFLEAMEWRMVSGGFEQEGPATAWARQLVPLVAGEEPSGLQRLMALADCGNGLSRLYDFAKWWFINVELSVHLTRTPVGEWFCSDAVSTLDASGLGLAESRLFDTVGRVGRGAQTLLVGQR